MRTDIKEASLARKGLYWQLLEIASAHELADWENVSAHVTEIGVDEERASSLYGTAVDWSATLRRNITRPVAG